MKYKSLFGALALGSLLLLAGCSNNSSSSNSKNNANVLSKNLPSAQSLMTDARQSLKNRSKSNVISYSNSVELDINDTDNDIKDYSYITSENGKYRADPALLNYVKKVETNDKTAKVSAWVTPNKTYTKDSTALIWTVENHKTASSAFQSQNNTFSDTIQKEIDKNSKVKEKGKYYVVTYSTDYNHPTTNKKITNYLKSMFKDNTLPTITKLDSDLKTGYFTENDYKSDIYINKNTKKIERSVEQVDIIYDRTKSDSTLEHYAGYHINVDTKYQGNDSSFEIPESILKNAHKNPFKTK